MRNVTEGLAKTLKRHDKEKSEQQRAFYYHQHTQNHSHLDKNQRHKSIQPDVSLGSSEKHKAAK